MKGLALSKLFYHDRVLPSFREHFPDDISSMAFGLVGHGSECYGFDDEFSRDHDWGARLCLWLPAGTPEEKIHAMEKLYRSLEGPFGGFGAVRRLDPAVGRDGVMTVPFFFEHLIGSPSPPETIKEWMAMREEGLSLATNGDIFFDGSGEIGAFRESLNHYFPRDLWLKKIASRCFAFSQYGQYNLSRALLRSDIPLLQYTRASALKEAAALFFLLRRRYRPYYKWLFHALSLEGPEGELLARYINMAASLSDPGTLKESIEAIARFMVTQLEERGLSFACGAFLQEYGFHITEMIETPWLRSGSQIIE
ncbi:DUF4037 domain-containing protein [Sediminispirochaeta smaragdinae]|uniref:DUF4037 domain-containing protein n=1 Tax=Sediminispirochaeta smaragdinae (strain DSM 11293 / JCM 15392 / SEBR 4228) TaxID=573413 RepID=E1RA93_SEDSS|nr:DUF4037 domain-containing protein [Sediminispirochaeta smaragdinae]ADK79384.1 conserved hypothetical protein [Sediminispirochaeta smaragdinae DSM 11293]